MSEKTTIKSSILLGKTVYPIDENGYVLTPSGRALFCGACTEKYNLKPDEDTEELLRIGAQLVENDEFSVKCPHCGRVAADEFENLRRIKLNI